MEQENTQAVALKNQVHGAVEWAQSLTVITADDANEAMSKLSKIKAVRKSVTDWFAPMKRAASEAHKAIVAKEKEITDVADEAERIAKAKVMSWQQEQARFAAEEQAKRQAEADEKARREREAAEKAAARLKTPELRQERLEAAAAIVAPVVTVTAPTVTAAGSSVRRTWKAELTDLLALQNAAVPGSVASSLLMFDQRSADAFARSTKGAIKVPGVRFVEDHTFSVRS